MEETKDKYFNNDLVYLIKEQLNLLVKKDRYDVKTIQRIQIRLKNSYLFKSRLQEYYDKVSKISGIQVIDGNNLKIAYQTAIDELIDLECELEYEDTINFVKGLGFN